MVWILEGFTWKNHSRIRLRAYVGYCSTCKVTWPCLKVQLFWMGKAYERLERGEIDEMF